MPSSICLYWQVSTFLLFVLPMVLITVLYIRIGIALRRSTITTNSYHHQQQQPPVAETPPPPAGAPAVGAGRVTRVTPARVAQSRKSIFKMLGESALASVRSLYSCLNCQHCTRPL